MKEFVIEFERTTKYPLINFFERIEFFMSTAYPELEKFFSGSSDSVNNNYVQELNRLLIECENIFSIFKGLSNKMSNLGYWKLLEYIENIQVELEKTSKLPKFKRTALTLGNYKQLIQFESTIGALRTPEDASYQLTNKTENWYEIIMNNDIQETDWDIDDLKQVKVFTPITYYNITTVIDQPIGKRIYGIDINRKISYSDNDLSLTKYEENIEQKCDILLNLQKGDIPEYINFGRTRLIGSTVAQFSLPITVREITNIFLQNDLFDSFSVEKFEYSDGGQLMFNCDIKTKYDYKTERNLNI